MKKVFTDLATYRAALDGCDLLFLLRPPQISEVGKYFKPLIDMAKTCNIQHILFLSVQGVEHSSIIPHHKIEQLIVASKIPYTFFLAKRREKIPVMLILVMIMLHYLPRFQKKPILTDWVEKITGRPPTTFDQFIHDNRTNLTKYAAPPYPDQYHPAS